MTPYVVVYPNGVRELCHNFTTAQRIANRTPGSRVAPATNVDIANNIERG